jgi:hypothetical protein
MIGLYDQTVNLYPTALTCGAEYLLVTSSLDPENPELLWLDGVVQMWYSTEDVITYSVCLSNDNGDVLSNEVQITVDTTVTAPTVDYNLVAENPGDVSVTYNDDGTVNIYIRTQFECENEDVFAQVTVGTMRYSSRDKVMRIENIPDESYALRYDVCMEIDGQLYSIFSTVPSGMVNEPIFYTDAQLTDKVLTVRIYKDANHADLNTVRIVTSTGEEIILSESDFLYNDEYGSYDAVAELAEYAEEAVIYVMANPYYNGLDDIDDYIGNTMKLFEITVYQP